MSLLTSTVVMQVNPGAGNRASLRLPMIEGTAMRVHGVQFLSNTQYTANSLFVLSHQRDRVAPAGTTFTEWDDASNWWIEQMNSASLVTVYRDLTGLDIMLAGPQTFAVFNNEGGTLTCGCRLFYERLTIPVTEWSGLAQATSFEA